MKIKNLILGGGLVGRMIHSQIKDSVIFEAKEELSNKRPNFSFGTNYLWKDIPEFKTRHIRIITRVDSELPTEASITRYKNKIGKADEKANSWGLQFAPESEGFQITELPKADVRYGMRVTSLNLEKCTLVANDKEYRYVRLFNTLPLLDFLTIAGLNRTYPVQTIFKHKAVYVRVVPIPPEVSGTKDTLFVNYISNPLTEPYRYSDHFGEGERHYESLTPIGFPHKRLYPGKIWWDPMVATILLDLKDKVTCFGRYGCWNPNELLHETYERIKEWKT